MRRAPMILVLAALSMSALAHAQPAAQLHAEPERRDRAVSVGLFSLQGFAGIGGAYEQLRPDRRWSWLAGGGLRANAAGDYGSITMAAGGEARYWLKGRALWADAAPRSMIGWFAGARLDLAWTRTRDQMSDRTIGDNLAVALTGTFGYRFLIRGRVAVTPAVGLGLTRETDLGGRLPGWTRGTARLGLAVGYHF